MSSEVAEPVKRRLQREPAPFIYLTLMMVLAWRLAKTAR
jgi:hypothetical protein